MALSTSYSPRFYTSAGVPLPGFPQAAQSGICGLSFSETIATTDLETIGDRHYCFPLPGDGTRTLHGFRISAGDMDSGTAALDADLVFIYVLNGVEVIDATPIYDSSVAGLFSAALAEKYVDAWRLIPVSDNGRVDVVFRVNVAAATPAAANLTLVPVWSTRVP
jgi:hypothetical protein